MEPLRPPLVLPKSGLISVVVLILNVEQEPQIRCFFQPKRTDIFSYFSMQNML